GSAAGTPTSAHPSAAATRAVDPAGTGHAAAPASTARRDSAPDHDRVGGIDTGTDVEHFADGRTVVSAVLGAEPVR
ncbi:hypothetical protein Q8814_26400, partial [Rhodococcus sp. CC-R104]|nr:hypothetical protein [Rhodococcus sp. CC-R104]